MFRSTYLSAPGCKLLQFIADNGLSQYLQEPTRQNNTLDQEFTPEEALLVTLENKDKIGDHQVIQFSLQIKKEKTAIENTNYNFSRTNFEAMGADLDDERLERSLSVVMPHRDFSFSRTKSLNLVGDISRRNTLPSKTQHGSTMMSSSPSQDVREPMMNERGTTLTKPVLKRTAPLVRSIPALLFL